MPKSKIIPYMGWKSNKLNYNITYLNKKSKQIWEEIHKFIFQTRSHQVTADDHCHHHQPLREQHYQARPHRLGVSHHSPMSTLQPHQIWFVFLASIFVVHFSFSIELTQSKTISEEFNPGWTWRVKSINPCWTWSVKFVNPGWTWRVKCFEF